jgi:anti-sigma B factor antagonist
MAEPTPVDIVRELWARFERDGVEAALGLVDEDVVYLLQLSGGRVLHGTSEVRAVVADLKAQGVGVEARRDTIEGRHDAVVASGTVRLDRPDGLQVGRYHCVFHFAGGRLRRLSVYDDRDEALGSLVALSAIAPPPPEFAVEVDAAAGGVRTVRPSGELDIGTAPKLERALLEDREAGDRVVLDLADLEFIDSTGLRVIVQAAAAAEQGRWELRLRHGRPAVRRVFEISGVLGALPFEDA